jgi:hypothetical protein
MEIDMRKTKTVCVSLSTAKDRRERVSSLFEKLGFTRWSFYDAKKGKDVAEGCALSHMDILSSHDFKEPLLLVEDDICETNSYFPTIDVPDNADAVYIGYSAWAWEMSRANQSTLSSPTKFWLEENMFRIEGMLSTHAILYLNKDYAIAGVEAMNKHLHDVTGNRHCDVALARLQKQYNVYATPIPYFFQLCPNNTYWTTKSIKDGK